jgi:hypothetical protein
MPRRRTDQEIQEELNDPNTSEDRRRRLRYELSRRRRVEEALDSTVLRSVVPPIQRQNAFRRSPAPTEDFSDIHRRMRDLGLMGNTITTPAGVVDIPYYTPQPGENVEVIPGNYMSTPAGVVQIPTTRARRMSIVSDLDSPSVPPLFEFEEDSDSYIATEASSLSLEDEYITNSTDENCKGEWMKRNCTSCQSPITLEAYTSDSDLISFKLYNTTTKKFGKGQCMFKNELREMLSTGEGNVFSIWKGGDTSGRGGKPTNRLVVKLFTGASTIYVTLQSAHKLFHSKDKIFYALPLYGGMRRRVGNLYGRIGVSENHGQVPGFQIYKLFSRLEIEREATGSATIKDDFNLDFLVSERMEELISMFMDTTKVREFLLKKIVEYIISA